ncbi:hypothetical protein [Candidatus Nitrosopumilus sediminis]|uniref:Novel STAND NTPase 3 domain-containing protein n=1 Tax=Candidatus Nitrosopumilus sediminis TaxID=1229909 RepID=K0B9X1_9ARCH|nr:hypothetical protein [Candidatus Nitrosopumilus sediminis]AFS82998.1 hypothetical protein NSED_05980 [Candidatus Nitrosopumilus sediminis]
MSKDPQSAFDSAKKQYESQKLLTILGSSGSGKTVVASLLLEALVNKFLPEHKDYEFRVNKGIQFMKKICFH